jgi:hypothetical protein
MFSGMGATFGKLPFDHLGTLGKSIFKNIRHHQTVTGGYWPTIFM